MFFNYFLFSNSKYRSINNLLISLDFSSLVDSKIAADLRMIAPEGRPTSKLVIEEFNFPKIRCFKSENLKLLISTILVLVQTGSYGSEAAEE